MGIASIKGCLDTTDKNKGIASIKGCLYTADKNKGIARIKGCLYTADQKGIARIKRCLDIAEQDLLTSRGVSIQQTWRMALLESSDASTYHLLNFVMIF